MKRDDVRWADLPPPIGRRPVLILTRSSAVAVRNQLVVALITRTRRNIASEVFLTQADGMPLDSVINCDSLHTIPKYMFDRQITSLGSQKLNELEGALRFALGIP